MTRDRLEVTLSVPADTAISDLVSGEKRLISIENPTENNSYEGKSHTFNEGEYALDKNEPTPSPEANTVEILETTGMRADEYVIEET